MSVIKYLNHTDMQFEDIDLIYMPTIEPSDIFEKRFNNVQSILVRMILIGQKKGRPISKEYSYEEAA